MKKITKDMKIMEAIKINPECGKILMESGFHCVGCHVAAVETIEQGCKAHGMKDRDIDKIIDKINKEG